MVIQHRDEFIVRTNMMHPPDDEDDNSAVGHDMTVSAAQSDSRRAVGLAHEVLQEQARANAEASRPSLDNTYNQAIKHFRCYVDNTDGLGLGGPTNDKYVTIENVNSYFTYVVALKTILPSGCKRIVNAIDKYAKDVEYTDGSFFKCGTLPLVVRALENQKNVFRIHMENSIVGDPHGKLSIDILKDTDHMKILKYIHQHTRNWRDMGFTWKAGFQTYIRTDSAMKLPISNIVV